MAFPYNHQPPIEVQAIIRLGLSCISNKAAGLASHKLTHQDVEEAAKIALPKMKATVLSFLSSLLG